MPRYTYGSFWCSMGNGSFLYLIFWAWVLALNVSGFIFYLLGHPVMAHFGTPSSSPAHSQYLFSLFNWVYIDWRLFVIAAKSSVYVVELIVSLDVPNVYPFFHLCSHLSNDSKNMKKRYGLSVSSCIVPLCIGIGFVFSKCSPENMVLKYE